MTRSPTPTSPQPTLRASGASVLVVSPTRLAPQIAI
jgi:hypothetical protein